MSEIAVEAVSAVARTQGVDPVQGAGVAPYQVDQAAVAKFEAVMETQEVTPVPFAQQIAETWNTAQVNHQGILHRIQALSDMTRTQGVSSAAMVELQYEVANLSFQQEVVTNIAKKASDAVSTLVKNG